MNWKIVPYKMVGPIALGMSREEVQGVLSIPSGTFYKTPHSSSLTDRFDDLGVHVFYDSENRCEAVELFAPAVPELDAITFLGRTVAVVLAEMRDRDSDVVQDDAGFVSSRCGVAVFSPASVKEPDAIIESVLVYRHGYFG